MLITVVSVNSKLIPLSFHLSLLWGRGGGARYFHRLATFAGLLVLAGKTKCVSYIDKTNQVRTFRRNQPLPFAVLLVHFLRYKRQLHKTISQLLSSDGIPQGGGREGLGVSNKVLYE